MKDSGLCVYPSDQDSVAVINLMLDNLRLESFQRTGMLLHPHILPGQLDGPVPLCEKRLQEAALHIRDRFGKSAMLKGLNLEESGTTIERNGQVGGHRA